MRLLATILTLMAFAVPAGAIEGLDMGPEPPEIKVRAYVSHDGVAPGGHLQLAVIYEVPENSHIQVNEFLYVEPAEGEPFVLGDPVMPATVEYEGEPVLIGNAVLRFDLAMSRETPLGERELKIKAGSQACSEQPIFACYAPDEKEVTVSVNVVPSGTSITPQFSRYFRGAPPPEAGRDPPPVFQLSETEQVEETPGETTEEETEIGEGFEPVDLEEMEDSSGESATEPTVQTAELGVGERLAERLRGALAQGSWVAFLLVFVAGFLTSFTPCVYPMIPITIGFVVKASTGRLSAFVLSLFFVLGIAIVYSSLGLVAALGGAVFGAALQSTAVTIFIAIVFTLMGISMLGAFDLALPSSFQTKLQTGRRGGFVGAVLMGGVTGLVASPCVGPVLVVLLTWVAQVGRPLYGFTLLFVFALGLGLLFLILGTFVGMVKSMPKAGAWMESVKHYFGWIFLLLAIFFLRTKLGPELTQISYGTVLVLFAAQMGAFTPLVPDPEHGQGSVGGRWRKGISIVIVILGIAMMADGLATHYGWKDRQQVSGPQVSELPAGGFVDGAGLFWYTDEATGLAEAQSAGKPVMIDFTAEWCGACHELEKKTWPEPRVAQELKRYVLLRLDSTERTPAIKALWERWEVPGLPTVIVLDSDGDEVDRFFGFRSADQVLPLLKQTS